MWGGGRPPFNYDDQYWAQSAPQFGPLHGRRGPRLHQAHLSAPTAYAGGPRRPLYEPPFAPGPLLRVPNESLYQDFNSPVRLNLSFTSGAVICDVHWPQPFPMRDRVPPFVFKVEATGGRVERMELPQWRTSMRMKTVPGQWYSVAVRAVLADERVIAEGSVEFRAMFTREEMFELHKKACAFVGSSVQRFDVFYRCKPKPYFDDIVFNRGSIMEKYIKDNNGQAASPINGAIRGLFFSARLNPNGTIPDQSPFGNTRWSLPAYHLFDPQLHRIYFADFYCNSIVHYVTVVVCVKGSDTDAYCDRFLVPLSIDNNPYVHCVLQPNGYMSFFVNRSLWVEIYFTEDLPLSLGRFDPILPKGAGTSTPGGLPHNKSCLQCNLYPLARAPLEPEPRADAAAAHVSADAIDADLAGGGVAAPADDSADEPPSAFNSTFHLAMDLVRGRLLRDGRPFDAGDVDVIEVLSWLSDAVVEQVGETVDVPAQRFVSPPRTPQLVDLASPPAAACTAATRADDAEADGEPPTKAPKLQDEESGLLTAADKENLRTAEGKVVFDKLKTISDELDRRCKELEKTLQSLQSSVNQLEQKIKPLRS